MAKTLCDEVGFFAVEGGMNVSRRLKTREKVFDGKVGGNEKLSETPTLLDGTGGTAVSLSFTGFEALVLGTMIHVIEGFHPGWRRGRC